MVEYREKGVKCQHSGSSLSFVSFSPRFLVDTSTKPQEMFLSLDLESSINAS
jgi:hypothetical protein